MGTPAYIVSGISLIPVQEPVSKLYPSASNGEFKVQLSSDANLAYQFTVYDILGNRLRNINVSNGLTNVEMGDLTSGIYLWTLNAEGQKLQTGKFVIQH